MVITWKGVHVLNCILPGGLILTVHPHDMAQVDSATAKILQDRYGALIETVAQDDARTEGPPPVVPEPAEVIKRKPGWPKGRPRKFRPSEDEY